MTASVSPQSSAREDYLFKFLEPCHQVVKEYLHPLQRISWALQGFVWPQVTLSLKDVGAWSIAPMEKPGAFVRIAMLKYPHFTRTSREDPDNTRIGLTSLTSTSSSLTQQVSIGEILHPKLSWVGSHLLVRGFGRRGAVAIGMYDIQSGEKKVEFHVPDPMQRANFVYDTVTAVLGDTTLATLHMQESGSCVRMWDLLTGRKGEERSFSSAVYGAENLKKSYFFGERYIIPKDEVRVTVVDFGGNKETVETCSQGTKVQNERQILLCQDEDYALMAQLREQSWDIKLEESPMTLFLSSRYLGNQTVGTYPCQAVSVLSANHLICLYDTHLVLSDSQNLVSYDLKKQAPEATTLLTWSEVFRERKLKRVEIAMDGKYLAVVDDINRVIIKEFEQTTPQSSVDANKKKETS